MDTWGLLPKSQEDNETIEQAIDRLIVVHEADPEAHLGAGESLETHRASEVIDHLEESIVSDKLNNTVFVDKVFIPYFASLDAFDFTGSPVIYGRYIQHFTSTVLNNEVNCQLKSQNWSEIYFAKNPKFTIPARIQHSTNGTVYFGFGDLISSYDERFVGFKFVDGTLYACNFTAGIGGAQTTTNLGALASNTYHEYKVEVESGVEIRFYIDGSLVATHTTNLPGNYAGFLMCSYCKCTSSGKSIGIRIFSLTVEQDDWDT